MKTYLWLSTAAFGLICLTCWGLSSFISVWYQQSLGISIPAFTRAVSHYRLCLLFFPVPWLVYSAVIGKRKVLNPEAIFVFSGTLFLGAALLVSVLAFAFILPWIDINSQLPEEP
jgi:hypothetical protein